MIVMKKREAERGWESIEFKGEKGRQAEISDKMTTGSLVGRLHMNRTWNRQRSISPADLGGKTFKARKAAQLRTFNVTLTAMGTRRQDSGRITDQTWVLKDHHSCHIEKLVLNKERLASADFSFGRAGVSCGVPALRLGHTGLAAPWHGES